METLTVFALFYYVTCACALKYRRIVDSSIITGDIVGSASQIQTSDSLHCVSSCEHQIGCEVAQFYTNKNTCILRTKVVLLYPVTAVDTGADHVTYTNLLGDCDDGWSRFGSSCYLPVVWGCTYPGSHYVTLNSEDENQAILQMTQQYFGHGYGIHLGLNGIMELSGLKWTWVTGEALGNYTNWAPGQPLEMSNSAGPHVALVYMDVNVFQWVYTSFKYADTCEIEL